MPNIPPPSQTNNRRAFFKSLAKLLEKHDAEISGEGFNGSSPMVAIDFAKAPSLGVAVGRLDVDGCEELANDFE